MPAGFLSTAGRAPAGNSLTRYMPEVLVHIRGKISEKHFPSATQREAWQTASTGTLTGEINRQQQVRVCVQRAAGLPITNDAVDELATGRFPSGCFLETRQRDGRRTYARGNNTTRRL
ncbi:hypothetical protein DPEC_G00299370 [Dallia pectoralis]|uniref:Uncharacterized protein n=1 Tax=Dallia pectoralis TaxID=75939 RepID=A0ACC2FG97_DALPE|nr:hypothetical protein DPEC_G00299370 [Dallia pectoralis]